jgi:hypothetical protein
LCSNKYSGGKANIPESEKSHSAIQIILWSLCVVWAVFLSLKNYETFQIGGFRDDAEYVVATRSLVHSDEYGLINLPGEPGLPRFPFGYPLILAPIVTLFPDNPDAMKWPALIASVLNAGLLFWCWKYFSKSTSCWYGLAVSGLYILSSMTVGLTRIVMSDAVFTTFCLGSILLAQRSAEKPLNIIEYIVMIVCLFFTLFTRTVGAIFVATTLSYYMIIKPREHWKSAFAMTVSIFVLFSAVITVTPIKIKHVIPTEYLSVLTSPSDWGQNAKEDPIIDRLISGSLEYSQKYIRKVILVLGGGDREREVFDRLGIPFFPSLVGIIIVLIIGTGYVRWIFQEGFSLFSVCVIPYLAILVLWSWRDERLLYPIQPQLYLGLLLGSSVIITKLTPFRYRQSWIRHLMLGAIVTMLISIYSFRNFPADFSQSHIGDLSMRTAWIRDNTESSSVIMTEEPPTDYIYGMRRTVPYPQQSFSTAADFFNVLLENHVNYFLVAPRYQWQGKHTPGFSAKTSSLLPLLEKLRAEKLVELTYSSEQNWVKVFKVKS